MSIEVIEKYAGLLSEAIKTKNHSPLMAVIAETFEAKAKLMGRSYHFTEKDKFEQFLKSLPGNLSLDIKSVNSKDTNQYLINVKMGMGMLKIPSQWIIQLDEEDKISFLEIR